MRHGRDGREEASPHPCHRIFYYYIFLDNLFKKRLTKGIQHEGRRRVNSGSELIIRINYRCHIISSMSLMRCGGSDN